MRVLTSFRSPRPTTNPYIVQLADSLTDQADLQVDYFSWRRAIVGRFDIFHVHWPEIMLEGRTLPRRVVRRLLTTALCLRLFLTHTPVVRTWHNLERPSGLGHVDHRILDLLDHLTTLRIRINDSGPMPDDAPFVTIPHGHYRDWFRDFPRAEPVSGRMVFAGRIRRYKGVESLIETFARVGDPTISLHVVGMPSSEELTQAIARLVDRDPRASAHLDYVDDAGFVRAVTESQLVVLPYQHMHNSGSVLAALSLDRPVLVPDNEVNRRLADEVGEGWIHLYQDEISPEDLVAAQTALREQADSGAPDLSARGWVSAGKDHVRAYAQAIELARG